MNATVAGGVRLFSVMVEKSTEIVVAAPTREEAEQLAREYAHDALMDADTDVSVCSEVTEASHWCASDEVWSAEDEYIGKTVSEVLEILAEAPLPPSEERGPVYWCSRCLCERVQWDWRKEEVICSRCEAGE